MPTALCDEAEGQLLFLVFWFRSPGWPSECKHCVAARKGLTIAPYGKEIWAAKQKKRQSQPPYIGDIWAAQSSSETSAPQPLAQKRKRNTFNSLPNATSDANGALATAAVDLLKLSTERDADCPVPDSFFVVTVAK